MSLTFNGSNQHLGSYLATPPPSSVLDYELTLACWFNNSEATSAPFMITITDWSGASSGDFFGLRCRGDIAGDPVSAVVYESGVGSPEAQTSSGFTAGSWTHGAAVFASSTSRKAYINGGSEGTNTTTISPSGCSTMNIGALIRSGASSDYFNGSIAEVGVWSVALTASEIAVLAAGYSPLLVRPESLEVYFPLIGNNNPETDLCYALPINHVNSPTKATHPRIIYPARPVYRLANAAAAATPPVPLTRSFSVIVGD